MFWIIALAVIAVLFWLAFIRPLSYWTRNGVKQTKPWLFIGDNWPALLRLKSFAETVIWVYNMHPKERYSGFYQFHSPVLVIRDSELIKQITVKDFDHFTDHLSFVDASIDPLWGGNLFALKGNAWRNMRATLSPSFTSSKMKFMFVLINEAAKNFIEYFDNKNEDIIELEIKDAYARLTNDVIASTAFGIKVDSLKDQDNEFYVMGKKATSFNTFKSTIKFLLFFLSPRLAKLLQLKLFDNEIAKFFRNLIDETIEVRESKGIVRPDMINLLLETRKNFKTEEKAVELDTGFATVQESDILINKSKTKLNLSNEDITAQALIFFFAGFDTVSTAMCFGSYELVKNPEVQQKLRTEIHQTFDECNGKLTYEALLKMKYMDMVVSEMLRMWTPAIATDRVCVKPYVIKPTRHDEVPVYLDVGNVISIPLHGFHHDPTYWPEPDKFIPERFSEENKYVVNPYIYMPFGVGPRNCIGSRFALLEIKAMFFYLLAKYEIVPIEKTEIPIKLNKSGFQHTAANGFWFGFQRINK